MLIADSQVHIWVADMPEQTLALIQVKMWRLRSRAVWWARRNSL